MFWRYLAVLSSTQTPPLNSSSNFTTFSTDLSYKWATL
jgi:hypothetical protein